MENFGMYLPHYTIGDHKAYDEIVKICSPYGKTACVIGGETALAKASDALRAAVGDKIELTGFIPYGGDSSEGIMDALAENETVQAADMLFGVGGGRAIDTVKVVGDRLGKPVFTFPTICSNCAPVTKVCVVYHDDHSMKGLYFCERPPVHCFINTDIIAEAPYKYFWAGIGDALSKQYESTFKARGKDLNHANRLGVDISRHCADGLLQYGAKALEDVKNSVGSEAVSEVILNVIINTGLTSVLVDNVYNSAMAHSFYYGTTHFPHVEENHLHGELVAYGILLLLAMDDQMDAFKEVYEFNKSVGLPTSYKDVELDDEHLEKLVDVMMNTKDIKDTPYEITRELFLKGLEIVENYKG